MRCTRRRRAGGTGWSSQGKKRSTRGISGVDRSTIERYRLALFGRMITGVAHEIDNHLSVVLGFAELLQLTAGNEKKVQDGAGKIMGAGDRINRIVKQFSQYVRPHEPFVESFLPAELLPEIFVFTKY